eukprot:NODE_7_length_67686_cov_1.621421.p33 type:complete len:228 gc:universal NODE_7_length_67686_cov_1.621421:43203-43886(+)
MHVNSSTKFPLRNLSIMVFRILLFDIFKNCLFQRCATKRIYFPKLMSIGITYITSLWFVVYAVQADLSITLIYLFGNSPFATNYFQMKEQSAKRPVAVARVPNVKKPRDPRFDQFRPLDFHQFTNNYGFLREQQYAEIQLLKDKIKKEPNEELIRQLQILVDRRKSRMQQERNANSARKEKKEEIAKVLHGKKPFYKKSVQQQQPKSKKRKSKNKFRKEEKIPLGFQ